MVQNGAHWVVTVPQTWHTGSMTKNEYCNNAERKQEDIRTLLVSALLMSASSDDPQQVKHVSALLRLSDSQSAGKHQPSVRGPSLLRAVV